MRAKYATVSDQNLIGKSERAKNQRESREIRAREQSQKKRRSFIALIELAGK